MSAHAAVVVPTLNAARWLAALLEGLARQKPCPPSEVIVVDSGSRDDTLRIASAFGARTMHVERFTHGGARNLGIRATQCDLVVLMTQDAEPANEDWLAKLTEPLLDPDVAGVYSRQIPRDGASPTERFFLADRFPAGTKPILRRHPGKDPPQYPVTFFSNVSSASRRETWMRFPFDETLLMSEDQQFAKEVLMASLAVCYAPESLVIHSHDYDLTQTFRRYFDSVVAFRQLSQSHGAGRSMKLGGSTLMAELRYIIHHAPAYLPYYVFYLAFKSAGVLTGHIADHIPPRFCRKLSQNPTWWQP